MKAVIVSDVELQALVDRLELKAMKEANHLRGTPESSQVVIDTHRAFHYIVTRWIQEVGGK